MDKWEAEKSEIVDDANSPVDVRELAYQHWAFLSGRNAAATSRMLKEAGHDVDDRLIRYWASSGEWAKRASDDLGMIAPDLRQQSVSELVYGGLESSRGLRETGRFADKLLAHVDEEITRVKTDFAAGDLDEVIYRAKLDKLYERAERVIKANVSAHVAMLDRAGFSPVGSNAPELPRVSVAEQAKAYRDMTPEERIEEQRRQLDAQRLPAKAARRKR